MVGTNKCGMGGKSTGFLEFIDTTKLMKFSGNIVTLPHKVVNLLVGDDRQI